MSAYNLRLATLDDVVDLVRLRRLMFESMGITDVAALDRADVACEAYFRQALPAGVYRGWVAQAPDGRVVASAGYVIDRHPPGPWNPTGRIGYIMNLYVEPAHRRRSLARRIMETILAHLRAAGVCAFSLHATNVGRPLYESLGFAASNEMRLRE
ncbi:MAG: GNAT family N-acetyltransferase [Chloroflexi bacterium]|nr:GNAT family N-acetyltransferase [Chloroflexota bacterium]MBU1748098.1 GNAT family N-acetyltransferase [Chloroflexota bacterium]